MDPTVPRSAPGKRHDWLTTDLLPDCAGYDSATQAAKGARIPARKPGFSTFKRECGRETDSPLEGDGFEPSVPGEIGRVFCPLTGAANCCAGKKLGRTWV